MTENRESPSHSLLRPINRRHLRLLLLATALIQAVMFLSYPLGTGSNNDNESAQKYLIGEVARGNFLVGNVRYNTGYALVMAPFKTLTDGFGRLSERALLLLQVLASCALPFLVYDIMRKRFDSRCALITATLVLVDPFNLQWAHFQLPGWLLALATVSALWLAQLAWSGPRRRRLGVVALAALLLGVMSFTRFNYAPLIAIYGLSFFMWRHIPFRERLTLFGLVGAVSGGILGAYITLIHIPSTGTSTLSCTAGATLVASLPDKNFQMRASNGPHSTGYAQLLTLRPRRNVDFYGETYPLWRVPGPWVGDEEAEVFFAQPFGEIQEEIDIVFPAALYWHLGPCAADALLYDVYAETVSGDFLKLAVAHKDAVFNMLIQHPDAPPFPLQYLDRPEKLTWLDEGWLGFQRAESRTYNGHRLWRPGVVIYSALFPVLNLIKLLTPLALVAAFWRRDWLLVTAAAMLLTGLVLIAIAATIEPRYYASMAPLFMILIGPFLARLLNRLRPNHSFH
ncbi:MAG: glycosyltransferase family 39 protein [Chloroflexi bacterium]|nr:glycosyltransferase family 39 protein [Chloroflexota bacterium]